MCPGNACGGACKRASLRLQGHLLPLGTLRESLEAGLAKADIIVLHNADLIHPCQHADIRDELVAMKTRSCGAREKHSCARSGGQRCREAVAHDNSATPIISTFTDVVSTRALRPRREPLAPLREGALPRSAADWWWDDCSGAALAGYPTASKSLCEVSGVARRPEGLLAGKSVVAVAALANPSGLATCFLECMRSCSRQPPPPACACR